jgi:hypothetical protein
MNGTLHSFFLKAVFLFVKSGTLVLQKCHSCTCFLQKINPFLQFPSQFLQFSSQILQFPSPEQCHLRIKTMPFPNQEWFSDKAKVIVLKSNDA